MELTLENVLGKDFKIEQFENVFFNTILNCIEQRFIEGDDSRIIDVIVHPNENFTGYFKITIRKQMIDTFDIVSHMVYLSGMDLKDKYISTINVDFTSTVKTIIDESANKLTKLTEHISKLIHTVQRDFNCVSFHIDMKEFEIPDIDQDIKPDTGILTFKPLEGEAITVMQRCMSILIDEFIARNGLMKSSNMVMNTTIEIECNIPSVGVKSKGKLVFMMNHVSKVDAVQLCVLSIPFIEEGKDQPYGLAIAFDSPNCGLARGGMCLTILEAELFGYKYQNQDKQIMGYIADYINAVAEEVDKWINIMSSDHKITLNMESEVI